MESDKGSLALVLFSQRGEGPNHLHHHTLYLTIMKAYAYSLRIAPKKANIVAKMVRGMPVPAAMQSLQRTHKKAARLNCIRHLLSLVPYEDIIHEEVILPERKHNPDYVRHPVPDEMIIPDYYS